MHQKYAILSDVILARKQGVELLSLMMVMGCIGSEKNGLMPDFTLQDVNPNSARYQMEVSPRDYLGNRSAWYFGHAT